MSVAVGYPVPARFSAAVDIVFHLCAEARRALHSNVIVVHLVVIVMGRRLIGAATHEQSIRISMMKKTYVLDTNVLVSDPNAVWSFEDNDVVVPMAVIEELDTLKTRHDVGHSVRAVSRTLDSLREKGSLEQGVSLPMGGILRVVMLPSGAASSMPDEFTTRQCTDNLIIMTASWLRGHVEGDCVLVTKDTNVRIKCDAMGIKCQDYLSDRIAVEGKQFYTGVDTSDDPVNAAYITAVYSSKEPVQIPEGISATRILHPNQILVVKDTGQSSVIVRVTRRDGVFFGTRLVNYEDVMGLKPRNKEQNFALNLLMDPSINLVTLAGIAGGGKTLLALAAGLEQLDKLGSQPQYDRVIVTRPVQTVGKDLGYLPGTLQEKMDPWITPIKDNLNFLVGFKKNPRKKPSADVQSTDVEPYLALLMKNGKIEIEAIPYIRGRSIPGAYLLVDEAQNLTTHELKTLITRSGEGTKVILTGDLDQIDLLNMDKYTSGLSYCIERFKDYDISGHVTLKKGERSQLATLASQIL